MGALRGIVIWAAIAILSAVAAGFLAGAKNRNPSTWAAWSFVFPPTLIVLFLLARNRGLPARTSSFDDDDRRIETP